jgi:hypothetical protein
MINIGKILKRSWFNLWNYRILWIFGAFLALTTGGTRNTIEYRKDISTSSSGFPQVLPNGTPEGFRQFAQWFTLNIEPLYTHPLDHLGTIFTIVGILFLVCVLFCIIGAFLRYPAETAVIRMVDEFEQTGVKLRFKQGWKLGWNRRAFRLWLLDLILAIPALVLVSLIITAGIMVYFSLSPAYQVTSVLGIVAAIGLVFLSLFLLIGLALFISLVRNFFARAITLDNLGVKDSFREGWAMFKRNWKSAGLVWLVMFGINIVVNILGMIAFFLFIPIYLILLVPASFVAAIPGLISYGISSIFASGPLTWIIALLVAAPFFFVILFTPLFVFSGWIKIYASNVWTLTYREIKAKESLAGPALPAQKDAQPEGTVLGN